MLGIVSFKFDDALMGVKLLFHATKMYEEEKDEFVGFRLMKRYK